MTNDSKVTQECTNCGHQDAGETKCCMVVLSVCASSVGSCIQSEVDILGYLKEIMHRLCNMAFKRNSKESVVDDFGITNLA